MENETDTPPGQDLSQGQTQESQQDQTQQGQADTNGQIAEGAAMTGEQGAAGAGAAEAVGGALDQEQCQEASQDARDSGFEFELGSTVYLFERNVDAASVPQDGYQAPKQGRIVKITDQRGLIDVETGGETDPRLIHHDIVHRDEAKEGQNYWSETDET